MGAIITLSILAIFVLYLGLFKAKKALLPVSLIGLGVALVFTLSEWGGGAEPLFSGMLLLDDFSVVFSALCIVITVAVLLLSSNYFDTISSNVAEYHTLLLFSLTGALIVTSFHNLVMLFIGIEIMSVALYILAGIRKRDFSSNEAALKYFLMGAFSTGFLLFGITLLYGVTVSFDLTVIRAYVLENPDGVSPLFYVGMLLLIVGLTFKVGVVPFHFWVPDVYQGAPTLITTYMSTVVKTAAFAGFLRVFSYCFVPLQDFWIPALSVLAILTLFIGNISAAVQSSFKRMLAYSSISHAGYMLFAIIAMDEASPNAMLMYAAAYSAASVVAFGGLILVKKVTGGEQFDAFNGLGEKSPFLAFVLTVSMLSLAGIPLTAGFIGKFMIFSNALAADHTLLVVLAVVNAAIGIYYYFRVIVAMYFKEGLALQVTIPMGYKAVFALAVLLILVLGVYPDMLLGVI